MCKHPFYLIYIIIAGVIVLVNKLLLRRLIIEAILHESTKQTLISKNPELDKYEKYLNTLESKYHSWLGSLFDEYRQKNNDISY